MLKRTYDTYRHAACVRVARRSPVSTSPTPYLPRQQQPGRLPVAFTVAITTVTVTLVRYVSPIVQSSPEGVIYTKNNHYL